MLISHYCTTGYPISCLYRRTAATFQNPKNVPVSAASVNVLIFTFVFSKNQLMAQRCSRKDWMQYCCQVSVLQSGTQWPVCLWADCWWTRNKKSQTLSLCPGAARHQIPSEKAACAPQTVCAAQEPLKEAAWHRINSPCLLPSYEQTVVLCHSLCLDGEFSWQAMRFIFITQT